MKICSPSGSYQAVTRFLCDTTYNTFSYRKITIDIFALKKYGFYKKCGTQGVENAFYRISRRENIGLLPKAFHDAEVDFDQFFEIRFDVRVMLFGGSGLFPSEREEKVTGLRLRPLMKK